MPNSAVWKIVKFKRKWHLFNLKEDLSEENNLAETKPQKFKELFNKWIRLQVAKASSAETVLSNFYLFCPVLHNCVKQARPYWFLLD